MWIEASSSMNRQCEAPRARASSRPRVKPPAPPRFSFGTRVTPACGASSTDWPLSVTIICTCGFIQERSRKAQNRFTVRATAASRLKVVTASASCGSRRGASCVCQLAPVSRPAPSARSSKNSTPGVAPGCSSWSRLISSRPSSGNSA